MPPTARAVSTPILPSLSPSNRSIRTGSASMLLHRIDFPAVVSLKTMTSLAPESSSMRMPPVIAATGRPWCHSSGTRAERASSGASVVVAGSAADAQLTAIEIDRRAAHRPQRVAAEDAADLTDDM